MTSEDVGYAAYIKDRDARSPGVKLRIADVDTKAEAVVAHSDTKPTNPKDAIGISKVPLHLVSGIVKAYAAIAHFLGNVKYGAWNWRKGGARASVYVAALYRHVDRWWEGEKYDPVDGTPHLANALACINILIETDYRGIMIDDRPPSTDLQPLYTELEAIMVKIKAKYKDLNPHHHTRLDP